MKAKITVRDINGAVWEKEGDIGMGAMAIVRDGSIEDTEIDFSSATARDLSYFLATALFTASNVNIFIAEEAIRLYRMAKEKL